MEGVRFLLELCLLGVVAYWAFGLGAAWLVRVLAGVGAPVAVAAVWGRYVAPRSSRRLEDPGRFVIEVVLFGLGAGALAGAGAAAAGAVLFGAYLLNRWALRVWTG